MPAELEPLYIICVGYPASKKTVEKSDEKKQEGQKDSAVKKAVLIIASGNFRDEELFETKRELKKANIETITASTRTGVLRGTSGGKTEVRLL